MAAVPQSKVPVATEAVMRVRWPSGPVILVADDEPGVRDSFSLFFKDTGAKLLLAPDAAKAIEFLNGNRVDAAIVDWKMPVGAGLAEKINKQGGQVVIEHVASMPNGGVPVLLFSASANIGRADDVPVGLRHVVSGVLPKLTSREAIYAAIEKAVPGLAAATGANGAVHSLPLVVTDQTKQVSLNEEIRNIIQEERISGVTVNYFTIPADFSGELSRIGELKDAIEKERVRTNSNKVILDISNEALRANLVNFYAGIGIAVVDITNLDTKGRREAITSV